MSGTFIINPYSFSKSSLNNGLIGAYNADNNAIDTIGGNNGTQVGSNSYTTGIVNQAFSFNGVTDYITVADNSWNYTGDFSISCFVYLNSLTVDSYLLANIYYAPGDVRGWFLWWSAGAGQLLFDTYNSNTAERLGASIGLTVNTWYHLCITISGGVTVSSYRNSILQNTETRTLAPNYGSPTPSTIGAYRNAFAPAGYGFTNGNMDIINIYNRVLTQDEVTQLYNSGAGKQAPF